MRHSRLALVLASLGSVGLVACFSSTSTNFQDNTDASEPDGGVDDATMPMPDSSMTREAGPDAADAGIDVVEEPSPPPPVQVLVVNSSGPEMGVTVVFSDATGALITTGTTDVHGSVVQELPAGSQVTALLGTSRAPNLVTVTGVKPGDVLTVADGPLQWTSGGSADVTFGPYNQPGSSVSDYTLNSGSCGTEGAPGTFEYPLSGCVNPQGQFPVLVQALGFGSPIPTLAWQSGTGSLADTDAGVASVDLSSASWSTTFGAETVTLANVPGTLLPSVAFSEYASSVPFTSTDPEPLMVDAGETQSTFQIHPGYGDFDQTEVDYSIPQSIGTSYFAIADRSNTTSVASPSASDAIDLDTALPAIQGSAIDSTNPVLPNISWTSATSLSVASATIVRVAWSDTTDDAGDVQSGTWTLVVPASQSSVVPPQIPSTSGFGPSMTATWSTSGPVVVSMNGDAFPFPTYDAIRATAAQIGPTLSPSASPMLPALPANGRVRVTAFVPRPQAL